MSEYYRHYKLVRKLRKSGVVALALRKKGEYRDNSILIRDLRFIANK